MASKNPETGLTNKIVRELEKLPSCCVEKRHGSNYAKAGQPDLSICYHGMRIELEVKVPKDHVPAAKLWLVSVPIWPSQAEEMLMKGTGSFPGNSPTPLQVQRLSEWEGAGALAAIVYSVDAAMIVMKMAEEKRLKTL